MAAPTVSFWVNISPTDYVPGDAGQQNRLQGTDNGAWKPISLTNTTLVFTGRGVSTGDASGTRDPIIIPAQGQTEAPRTFIDVSGTVANMTGMVQIPLAGTNLANSGGGKIAVFGIWFVGATAGPPFLEYWDNDSLSSTQMQSLGAGNPQYSFIWGMAPQSTNSTPQTYPDNWTGTPLAGGGNNRLKLYPTAIPSGGTGTACYYNLKVVVPSSASPFNDSPICVLRYTYN